MIVNYIQNVQIWDRILRQKFVLSQQIATKWLQPSWEMNPESLLCCFSRSSSIFSSPPLFVNASEGKRPSPTIALPGYTLRNWRVQLLSCWSICFQRHDHYLAPSSRCTIHNTLSDCRHQTNALGGGDKMNTNWWKIIIQWIWTIDLQNMHSMNTWILNLSNHQLQVHVCS